MWRPTAGPCLCAGAFLRFPIWAPQNCRHSPITRLHPFMEMRCAMRNESPSVCRTAARERRFATDELPFVDAGTRTATTVLAVSAPPTLAVARKAAGGGRRGRRRVRPEHGRGAVQRLFGAEGPACPARATRRGMGGPGAQPGTRHSLFSPGRPPRPGGAGPRATARPPAAAAPRHRFQ
jgi:hypothetical protein